MNLILRKLTFGFWALVLSLPSFAQEEGTEFISTWGFASNLGWKGIEIQAGFSFREATYYKDLDHLRSVSRPNRLTEFEDAMNQLNSKRVSYEYQGVLWQTMAPFQISGVFLPFRHSKYKVIRRTEWHCGLEMLRSNTDEPFIFEGKDRSIQLHSRSIFLTNKFLAELRLGPITKLYGGIQGRISIMPNEQLQIIEYIPASDFGFGSKFVQIDQLNSTRFAFGGGLTAGIKIALDCRLNLHLEYRYDGLKRLMQQGSLFNSYHGLSVGFRYKFIKPDESEGTSSGPFW
ncbi:MAG: hypothetical protein EP332_10415 [Bacteroidetes bacterium]|nr:MAG: hypothetical protein EP332_10415 [Bacteroidota bacterium]